GKKEGNDIKEKKITLPLIHALREAGVIERRKIFRIIRKKKKGREEIREVIDFVKRHHGLEYAEAKMNEFAARAMMKLDKYPDTETKSALTRFVLYSTSRKK
ncbi:MAG: polyprenyl synthetase family protein, partial [Bacteroidales bacterium]|nr:polyprenyl synthetase family protein [Bacteroidales bacterium]